MKISIGKYILLMVLTIIISSCTSSDSKFEDRKLNDNIKYLPPESVLVSGSFLQLVDGSDTQSFKIRIDSVFGYGQSTPPLAIGSEIDINIPSVLLDKLGGKSNIDEFIGSQKSVKMEIKNQKLYSLEQKSKSGWSVTKIIN